MALNLSGRTNAYCNVLVQTAAVQTQIAGIRFLANGKNPIKY